MVGRISSLALAVFAGVGQVEASELPAVPEGFEVELFAKEPLIRNAGPMAFDSRGGFSSATDLSTASRGRTRRAIVLRS